MDDICTVPIITHLQYSGGHTFGGSPMARTPSGVPLRPNVIAIPENGLFTRLAVTHVLSLLFLTCTILLPGISLHAQEYRGTITGQVTDPKGDVVPNANITAMSPEQTYN